MATIDFTGSHLKDWLVIFINLYLFLVQSSYLISLILSIYPIHRFLKLVNLSRYFKDEEFLPISVIVPAYNESLTIVDNVWGFLNIDYPEYEIIVVNDGSSDDSLNVLKKAFRLIPIEHTYSKSLNTEPIRQVYYSLDHPQLMVVDKENGGKADAINTGINVSRYPLFCVVDADSILEKNALKQICLPFIESQEEIVAVGGIIRIINGCTIGNGQVKTVGIPSNHWARLQTIEYLRAFLFGRVIWSEINSLLIIAGAFSVFKKTAVVEVGGFLTNTVGEDMEITVHLHRYRYEHNKKWSLKFIPNPVCWTQAPEDIGTLKKQRNRWHRGLAETLWRHRRMFFNPKYGRVGLLGMPYFVFAELLSPIFELVGLILIPILYFGDKLNIWYVLVNFGVLFLYSQIISATALLLEEFSYQRYKSLKELLLLFSFSFLEGLYFRFMNSWWKFQAFFEFRSKKHSWGEMQRNTFRT